VADFNTLLVGSMTAPARRHHEAHLLAEKHGLLVASGVRGFDIAQLGARLPAGQHVASGADSGLALAESSRRSWQVASG
jgi:hypothetical protein